MTSDFAAHTRFFSATSVPAPRPGSRPTRAAGGVVPSPTVDIRLHLGNLMEVSDALGAQTFCLVDGEVTFTARSEDCVRRWRGHLDAQGLVEL